jgi:uncharacterized protein (DUF1330 family)
MPKGYWIITFRAVRDSSKLDRYIELAAPVLAAAGVRFVVRGMPARVYEAGLQERTVVIEFENLEKAIAVYESAQYQESVEALGDGAERDLRVIAGLE